MIRGNNGQPSVSTDVGWMSLLISASVNNSVWDTKSVTSGVSGAYIELDTNRQILSVPWADTQGDRVVLWNRSSGNVILHRRCQCVYSFHPSRSLRWWVDVPQVVDDLITVWHHSWFWFWLQSECYHKYWCGDSFSCGCVRYVIKNSVKTIDEGLISQTRKWDQSTHSHT